MSCGEGIFISEGFGFSGLFLILYGWFFYFRMGKSRYRWSSSSGFMFVVFEGLFDGYSCSLGFRV